jgi:hypothetical protein
MDGYRVIDARSARDRRDCFAKFLGPSSAVMAEVFGFDVYPVRSPIPETVEVEGMGKLGPYPALILDAARLTAAQRARVIAALALLLKVPRDQVVAELDGVGVPLLIEPAVVTVILIPDADQSRSN